MDCGRRLLLEVRRRERLDHRGTIGEPRLEDAVRILEHAILQTDNDELTALEPRLDQATDILSV